MTDGRWFWLWFAILVALLVWVAVGCGVPAVQTENKPRAQQDAQAGGDVTQESKQPQDAVTPEANPSGPVHTYEPNMPASKTTEAGASEVAPKASPTIGEVRDYTQNVTAAKYSMDAETRRLLGGMALMAAGLFIMALFLPAPAGGRWEVVGVLMGFGLMVGAIVLVLVVK